MKKKYFVSVYKGQIQSKFKPENKYIRRLAGKAYSQRIKGFFNQRTFARGFTLIELLVVIGIIAILAAVVIVAINPARQFALARDTQRMANIAAILDAVDEDMSEHQGMFICGPDITNGMSLPTSPEDINDSSIDANIAPCIVPNYIASMPFDPSPGSRYNSPQDYETRYSISQDQNGHITVSAVGELTNPISVTR